MCTASTRHRPLEATAFIEGNCRREPTHPSRWPKHRRDCSRQVDDPKSFATLKIVDVVLRKLGKGSRAVSGRLVRAPRKGSVVVIEFPDGMHEYVTTPVKRVLRLAGRDVFYIETVNSRYRLEVRTRGDALAEANAQNEG